MTYKTCIITKLLIPPHNTYPLPFRFLYQKLEICYPSFTNSKHSVFIGQPASPAF